MQVATETASSRVYASPYPQQRRTAMNTWKRISAILILAIAVAGLLCGQISPGKAAVYQVTKITDDDYQNFDLNHQGHLVWGGKFNVTYKAWLYRNGANELIYSGDELVNYLRFNNINDSDQVVWDSVSSTNIGDIYLYSGGGVSQLTDHEIDHVAHANPQINNPGDITWQEWGKDGARVVLRKGGVMHYSSPYCYSVTSPPWLNNLGQMVWAQIPKQFDKAQIFFYDGVTTHQLTSSTDGDNIDPIINDRGDIIWAHQNPANKSHDLQHYRAGTYTTITPWLYYVNNYSYALNNLGEIVWMADGPLVGPNLHVYYDGANHLIDNNKVVNYICPAINNQGLVAYAAQSQGLVLTNYRTGLSTVIKTTDGPFVIKLNDRGQVAWRGGLNLDYCNLYLASPTSSTTTIINLNLLLGD